MTSHPDTANFRLHRDIQRILEHLEPLAEPSFSPVLVVLSGLPGVGKSTFARTLRSHLPLVIVETDDIRKTLFQRPQYSNGEHAWVFRVAYEVIGSLLRRDISVVFDATNLQETARKRAYRLARDAGARLAVVAIHAPPEVVRQRMEARANGATLLDRSDATWEVYQAMAASVEPIRRPHHVVDTSGDISAAIEAVVAAIRGGSDLS